VPLYEASHEASKAHALNKQSKTADKVSLPAVDCVRRKEGFSFKTK